jgi:hypothetical protein
LKGGRITEGFALVAWPDTCGDTGAMTFIVDRDAVVYEKDLGPDTTAIARDDVVRPGLDVEEVGRHRRRLTRTKPRAGLPG